MNNAAATVLCDILKNYGRGICDTPRMFDTLLHQQARAFPEETAVLSAAVRHNVVRKLAEDPNRDRDELAHLLTDFDHVPEPDARWAVDSWAAALGLAPAPKAISRWNDIATPTDLARDAAAPVRNALYGLVLVLLTGAAGGVIPGIWFSMALARHDSFAVQHVRDFKLLDSEDPVQFGLIYGTLGAFAGAVGGAVGFMFGGKTRLTPGRVLGAMIGAFLASADGVAQGMFLGGHIGAFATGLIVTIIGTYIATLLGVLTVLWLLGRLAYLILWL
jgi:hypothetical protein